MKRKPLNVALIGGGTGIAGIAKMLPDEPDIRLSLIHSTFDDGGHSGELRKKYPIGAVGDIRKGIEASADPAALATDLGQRFLYRDPVTNRSGGNDMIVDLLGPEDAKDWKRLPAAIASLSLTFGVKGRVIPVSLDIAKIVGFPDGSAGHLEGQLNADTHHAKRSGLMSVSTIPETFLYEGADRAIREADIIVFCPGSFWGSVMINLSVTGLREAINLAQERGARVVMVTNILRPIKDDGMLTSADLVHKLAAALFIKDGRSLDAVFSNDSQPSPDISQRLASEHQAMPVPFAPSDWVKTNVSKPFVDWSVPGKPRYGPAFAKAFLKWARKKN